MKWCYRQEMSVLQAQEMLVLKAWGMLLQTGNVRVTGTGNGVTGT